MDEKTIEECEILPISLEKDPRDLDTGKDDFINMFEQWKKYILQDESKKVYEKYLLQRSKLSKNALDEYESIQNSR